MKTKLFIAYGDIGDINENIFNGLREDLKEEISAGTISIKGAGGIPKGISVKNRSLTLDIKKNLLRAEVNYEIKL